MKAKTNFRGVLLFIAACILLSSAHVFAYSISLTGMPTTYATALDGKSYPVGPIKSSDNAFGYVCIDFFGPVAVNTGNPTGVNVSIFDSLEFVKFGAGNVPGLGDQSKLVRYQEAAWLLLNMKENPVNTAVIQFALWNIFTPGAPDYPGQATWITNAYKAVVINGFKDFSSIRVYTPTGLTGGYRGPDEQELMSLVSVSVPDGDNAWLFFIGLAGLAAIRRWPAIRDRKGN